jgi:hypothetical protein
MKHLLLVTLFFFQITYSQGCDPKKYNNLGAIKFKSIQVESKPWVKGKDMPWQFYETCTIKEIEGFKPNSKKFQTLLMEAMFLKNSMQQVFLELKNKATGGGLLIPWVTETFR